MSSITSGILYNDCFCTEEFTDYQLIPTDGFHCIYKAKRNGRFFILKGLKPEYRENPSFRMILRKEYEICTNLSHQNIVHTYGKTIDPVVGPCIILEYVSGRTLQEVIDNNNDSVNAFQFVHQMLDALEYMQNYQVIHRDLKPDNIIIANNSNNVKIIDFCLADQDSFDILKSIHGQNEYMAPENQLKDAIIDCRADLYSFAKITKKVTWLYPYIVHKCSRKNPQRRYRSARLIKISLRRNRFIFDVLLILMLLLVCILSFFDFFADQFSVFILDKPPL